MTKYGLETFGELTLNLTDSLEYVGCKLQCLPDYFAPLHKHLCNSRYKIILYLSKTESPKEKPQKLVGNYFVSTTTKVRRIFGTYLKSTFV